MFITRNAMSTIIAKQILNRRIAVISNNNSLKFQRNNKNNFYHVNVNNKIDTLLNNKDVPYIVFSSNNQKDHDLSSLPSKYIVFPGSFNPLHQGHEGLADVVQNYIQKNKTSSRNNEDVPVFFEISAMHPDKGLLEKQDLLKRIDQFIKKDKNVIISRAPLYVDKARNYPNSILAVGADTMIRILDPKYQKDLLDKDQINSMINDLKIMLNHNVSFIVAGRKDNKTNEYLTCNNIINNSKKLNISSKLLSIFEELPEEEFRVDISSTEIRARRLLAKEEKEQKEHNKKQNGKL